MHGVLTYCCLSSAQWIDWMFILVCGVGLTLCAAHFALRCFREPPPREPFVPLERQILPGEVNDSDEEDDDEELEDEDD